ncbi:hypothetical protein SprV_0100362500 [Sparganum proliferum]
MFSNKFSQKMKTFLLSVIFCLLLSNTGTCISTLDGFPTDCGTPKIPRLWKEEAMYSKTQATAHSWPWLVGLWSGNRGEHPFCGGTLISKKLVLTSARCIRSLITCDDMPAGKTFNITNVTGDTLFAHLGEHTFTNPNSSRQSIKVELVQIHPTFGNESGRASADVALLQLTEEVKKSETVDYICVPSEDMGLQSKDVCYYAGWGAVLRRGTAKEWKNPRVLREAEVSITGREQCTTAKFPTSAENTTCIEVEARSPCHGDAGGGLFCRPEGEERWFLNGVLSNGDEMCISKWAVTTKLTSFLKWLSENTSLKIK